MVKAKKEQDQFQLNTSSILNKAQVMKNVADGLYLEYPELFIPHSTGEILEPYQREIVSCVFKPGTKKRFSVRAGHGIGKTWLSSHIAYQFMMMNPLSLIMATGPTGKQTRNQFWSYLDSAFKKSIFFNDVELLKQKIYIKGHDEDWRIIWVTSRDPATIEGFHNDNLLWIIEEGKGVEDPVYEALSGALSKPNNLLYISSTCGPPRGHFFDSHNRLRNLYHTFHIPSTESARVSPEQIAIWEEQWGGEDSAIFKARVLAIFPSFDDSYIANLADLMDAIETPEERGELYS